MDSLGYPFRLEMDSPTVQNESYDPNKGRRSSSRSIKRPKFDDELVEFSSSKDTAANNKSVKRMRISSINSSPTYESALNSAVAHTSYPIEKKKSIPSQYTIPALKPSIPTSAASKKSKKKKHPQLSYTKDLGRWKPSDDLALITAVLQSNSLEAVHRGIKFSCKFTFQEMQQRWFSLLYDEMISKLAMTAVCNLNPDTIANVESKTLLSQKEYNLLASVVPGDDDKSDPKLEQFEQLLRNNPEVFHSSRTAKILQANWLSMRKYYLLNHQQIPEVRQDILKSNILFSEFEDFVNDKELFNLHGDDLKQDLEIVDKKEKKEIMIREAEVKHLKVIVEHMCEIPDLEFDQLTVAIIKGRCVRFLMRSAQVTVGRTGKEFLVDVDLMLEGPAYRVSRRQATIRLRHGADFFILNEGQRPIYIDGNPLMTGATTKLNDSSLIQICDFVLLFLINPRLTSIIREVGLKLSV